MGPFDGDIGPYAEMTITTRKSDVQVAPDNVPGFRHVLIGLLLTFPALWVIAFMGLFLWANVATIAASGIIGLCFWFCAYYGTKHGIIDRFRYRTTEAQRATIKRRLSGSQKV